jgi:drug/metabolite transporter (DMT)-like permease
MSATGKGIVFALFAGFVYGLAPPFTRLAFVNGVPAIETAFWRVSALVVIVGLIAIVMRWRLRVPQGAGGLLALMALSTGAISIGYLGAVQFIPVALAVIIFFTFPILILILSPMIEGRGVRWPQLAIGAVAFAGLLVALGPNPGNADWRGLCLAAARGRWCSDAILYRPGVVFKNEPVAFRVAGPHRHRACGRSPDCFHGRRVQNRTCT